VLVSLQEKYGDVIQSWSITDFDQAGPNIRFKAQVTFVDQSVLFIRQVVIGESILSMRITGKISKVA